MGYSETLETKFGPEDAHFLIRIAPLLNCILTSLYYYVQRVHVYVVVNGTSSQFECW